MLNKKTLVLTILIAAAASSAWASPWTRDRFDAADAPAQTQEALRDQFARQKSMILDYRLLAVVRTALDGQIAPDEEIVAGPELAGKAGKSTADWYVKTKAHICKVRTTTRKGATDPRDAVKAEIVQGCFQSPS